MKVCRICQISKPLTLEYWYWRKDSNTWRTNCKDCKQKEDNKYKNERKQERYLYNKDYVSKNKSSVLKYSRKYKEKYRHKRNLQLKKRRQNDCNFKLRALLSSRVTFVLKNNNSSKNGNSVMKFLPYTVEELKQHIEAQFEPWMTWQNWGRYFFETWNDEDPSTWTWQIDHIIPQAKLPYAFMEDENFKKCWALENLRPLASKINLLKGARS